MIWIISRALRSGQSGDVNFDIEAERLARLGEQALGRGIPVWFSGRPSALQVAGARHVPPLPSPASFDLEMSLEFSPED